MTYRCKVRHTEKLGTGTGTLPKRIGYWHYQSFTLPGLTTGQTRGIIQAAFVLANQYVPIPFVRSKKREHALITIEMGSFGQFDGMGGTLAEAEVVSLLEPDQRGIWFDPDESWARNQAGPDETYALPVLCHEIGHTLGFGHGKVGLMAPYYDPLVTTPTKAEVKKFMRAYF